MSRVEPTASLRTRRLGAKHLSASLVAVLISLNACLSPSPPAPSGQSSAPPSGGSEVATACQPIDLRSPAGQRVDLTGAWTTDPSEGGFLGGFTEIVWIQQIDNCVWGAILDKDLRSYFADDRTVGTLQAHISQAFVVEGDLVTVVSSPGEPKQNAPLRLRIEWQSNGQILLREDRDPNVEGPRCDSGLGGTVFCPDPVVLYRVEEDPLTGNWATGATTCGEQTAAIEAAGFTVEEMTLGGWSPTCAEGMTHGSQFTVRFASGNRLLHFNDGRLGWDGNYRIIDGETFEAGVAGGLGYYITYRYAIDGNQLTIDMIRNDCPLCPSEAELLGEQIAQTVIYETSPFTRLR